MAILGLESDDGRQEVAAKLMRINIIRVQKNRKMEFKQNMQRSYNVTLKRVVQPFLEWKSSTYYIFWVCVCNLQYPASKVHASDCHLWPARRLNIFPPYLIIGEPGSVVDTATRYRLEGPRIESRCGRHFPHLFRRPWGPPSLLYNGCRVFPGVKAAGAWCWPHTHF